jgi:hypothetical protein
MAAIAGLRGTGSGDWGTDERPKNFREMILWRNPNGSAPLTALMAKMRSESTDDPEFAWYEEEMNPVRCNVSSAMSAAGVTAVIDSGDAYNLVAGDLVYVEAAAATATFPEIMTVVAVQSSTQFTVTRGSANTSAAGVSANAKLLKIGNAFEEGTTSPASSTRNPTKNYNYTQIFKTAYRITNTAKATRFRTGDPVKNDKKRRMFDHSVSLEQAFLFGARHEATGGTASKPQRYTGGLYYFLQAAYNATTAPTIKSIASTVTNTGNDALLDAVYQVFDYNTDSSGNERIVLCGNGFLNYMNKWVKYDGSTRINYEGTIRAWGMELQKWTIPQGTLYLKTHPLMNVNSRFTNGAFVIDPSGIRYRPLSGRDTKFQDNIQANDADETKGQWITEAGVEFHHLKSMRYLAVE